MADPSIQADPERVRSCLRAWVSPHVDDAGRAWLDEKRRAVAAGAPDWVLFTSFSAVPRYTGKADLKLAAAARAEAEDVRPGWNPTHWSVDQAARALIVLSAPASDPDAHVDRLTRIFETADVGEAVALYQALPLFPHPDRYVPRAVEGLRTNMTSVFAAIALRNPFPAERFDEDAWNQMVLKAVFVGVPLDEIHGFDARANATLARMLVDYAHERWAAGREVTPLLWRAVGPFAQGSVVDDLARALASERPDERAAAALALSRSPDDAAAEYLAAHPDLAEQVERGAVSWDELSA